MVKKASLDKESFRNNVQVENNNSGILSTPSVIATKENSKQSGQGL